MKITVTLMGVFGLLYAQTVEVSEGHLLQYKGSLGAENWVFPLEAKHENQVDAVTGINGKLELVYQTPWSMDVVAKIVGVYDFEDNKLEWVGPYFSGESRTRLYAEDLNLSWFGEEVTAKLGYQVFNWKTVEGLSWTDVLNQVDQQHDFFDAPKLGELAAYVQYLLPTEEEQSIDFIYLPHFTPTRLALTGSRFDLFAGTPIRVNNSLKEVKYGSENKRLRPQYAMKYNTLFMEDFDVSFMWFHGYNRTPMSYLTPTIDGAALVLKMQMLYEPAYHLGINFQGTVGDWLVKGEVMGHQFEKDEIEVGLGRVINTEASLGATIGFEYTMYSALVDDQDLGLILETVGHTQHDQSIEEVGRFIPFTNHVFLGMRYAFNNTSNRSILLGVFSSVKEYEVLSRLEYEERIFERFKIKLKAFWLLGQKESGLKDFEKASRLSGELAWNF